MNTIHVTSGSMRLHDAELVHRDEKGMVEAFAAALVQLANSSMCCSGGHSCLPMGGASPASPAGRERVPLTRGHHRCRPVSRRFVLPEVTVIEPTVRREVADVVVADGRIVDVLPPGSGPYEGYDSLDVYRGSFVMPSLTDMHTHLPPHNFLNLIDHCLLLYLAHGITTIRNAGDSDGTTLPEYLDGMAAGRFIGPRAFDAGPFIVRNRTRWKNILRVEGPGDAEGIARKLVGMGCKCMKIYENLTVPEIAALERAAADQGLITLGHVPTHLGIEEAKLKDAQHFFGVAPPASLCYDHVLHRLASWGAVDDKRMDTVVRSAVEGGLANTPTLVVNERLLTARPTGYLGHDAHSLYLDRRLRNADRNADLSLYLLPRFFREVVWHPQNGLPSYRCAKDPGAPSVTYKRFGNIEHAQIGAALEKKFELVRRLYHAGATLRIGTDWQAFTVPGHALHMELKLFEQAGIPTPVVLRMATRDAALALRLEDLGVIRKGAIADLLVCEGDPTQNLDALKSMRALAHQGALYSAEHIWDEINDHLDRHERTFMRYGAAALAHLTMWATLWRYKKTDGSGIGPRDPLKVH